jgi:hypothetical protein
VRGRRRACLGVTWPGLSVECAAHQERIDAYRTRRQDHWIRRAHHPLELPLRSPESRETSAYARFGAELRQLRVPDRANERLKLGLDLERAGDLHDGADLDDLHLCAAARTRRRST